MTVSKCQKLPEGSESSEKEQLPQCQQERVATSSLLLLQHGKETTPDTFKRVDTTTTSGLCEKLMTSVPTDSNTIEGVANLNKFLNSLFGLYSSVGFK